MRLVFAILGHTCFPGVINSFPRPIALGGAQAKIVQ